MIETQQFYKKLLISATKKSYKKLVIFGFQRVVLDYFYI